LGTSNFSGATAEEGGLRVKVPRGKLRFRLWGMSVKNIQRRSGGTLVNLEAQLVPARRSSGGDEESIAVPESQREILLRPRPAEGIG